MDFSRGPAITSVLHTDEHSHIEPVRYAAGSGFFRTMVLPLSPGGSAFSRLAGVAGLFARPGVNPSLTITALAERARAGLA